MKTFLGAAALIAALSALAGCGGDDGDTATDPASATPSGPTDEPADEPADEPTVGSYPEFGAEDYTYTLEQICYCPLTGPVAVTVEDGEVTSATITKGGRGMKKGSEAPQYVRLTINDVIARANDTGAAEVVVDWPDGQEWPNSVAVDQIEDAVDDEITYLVRDVQVR